MQRRPSAYKEYFEPDSDVGIPRQTLRRHNIRIAEAERIEANYGNVLSIPNEDEMDNELVIPNDDEMEYEAIPEGTADECAAAEIFREGAVIELEQVDANETTAKYSDYGHAYFNFEEYFEERTNADPHISDNDSDAEADYDSRPESDTPFENLQQFLSTDENIDISLTVNKKDLIIRILKHAIRYKCNKSQLAALMQLFDDILQIAILPSTVYLIDKLFNPHVDVRCHAICDKCQMYIGVFERGQRSILCSTCNLNVSLLDEKNGSFFVTFNIKRDVQRFLKQYASDYKYIIQERPHIPDVLKDMSDGILYREFVQNLPDDVKQRFLTFMFNLDGAPVFESSTSSIWPMYVQPNELPLNVRSRCTILAGLWFGKSKPRISSFLVPFVDEMNTLTETGILCTINGEEVNIKPYFIVSCVDSMARAPMQGLHQCNGRNGCNWCLHPGKIYPGTKPVRYPVQRRPAPNRTHDDSVKDAEEYERKKAALIRQNRSTKKLHVNGFICKSPLVNLQKFNIINGFVPDYMHCCVLGITKQFTNYWLDSRINVTFSLKANLNEIDNMLLQIRPHSAVDQLPRSLEIRSFWKAKEWLNWLLYYSVPILSKFMKKQYMDHYLLFVEGLYLLLQETITFAELNRADDLFRQFQNQTLRLYGKFAMTYNLHQLQHVVESVYNYGNLAAHNAFGFENANGDILLNIHAGRGVINQVIQSIGLQKCINFLLDDLTKSTAMSYSDMYAKKTKQSYRVEHNIYFGKPKKLSEIFDNYGVLSDDTAVYNRLLYNNRIYSTRDTNKKTENCFALLENGNYVKLKGLLVDKRNNNAEFLLVQFLTTDDCFPNGYHQLQKIQSMNNNFALRPLRELAKPCVRIEIENQSYVIAMPQSYYF